MLISLVLAASTMVVGQPTTIVEGRNSLISLHSLCMFSELVIHGARPIECRLLIFDPVGDEWVPFAVQIDRA